MPALRTTMSLTDSVRVLAECPCPALVTIPGHLEHFNGVDVDRIRWCPLCGSITTKTGRFRPVLVGAAANAVDQLEEDVRNAARGVAK